MRVHHRGRHVQTEKYLAEGLAHRFLVSTFGTSIAGIEDGRCDRYDFGEDWLVEEHLLVPDASGAGGPARWVVGTALNMRERRTFISVFGAGDIAAGPVARVALPYALPLGLHGSFSLNG